MPISTQGRKRDKPTIVQATTSIFYLFNAADLAAIPGVSNTDVTALGHLAPGSGGAGTITVAGAKAPKPARFRKRLTGTADNPLSQESIVTFGNGTSSAGTAAAAQAGWRMIEPPREVSFGDTTKGKNVAVKLTNGVYVVRNVPTSLATSENATLLGWDMTLSATTLAKAVRAAKDMKCATVRKRLSSGATITLPCKKTKLEDAYAAGYKKGNSEFIGDSNVIPD